MSEILFSENAEYGKVIVYIYIYITTLKGSENGVCLRVYLWMLVNKFLLNFLDLRLKKV